MRGSINLLSFFKVSSHAHVEHVFTSMARGKKEHQALFCSCLYGFEIVGTAELIKREHKKNGRKLSLPAPIFARLTLSSLPHSFAPSPLSESLEQAT